MLHYSTLGDQPLAETVWRQQLPFTYPEMMIHVNAPIAITPPAAPSSAPRIATTEFSDSCPDDWTLFGLNTRITVTPLRDSVEFSVEDSLRRISSESAGSIFLNKVTQKDMSILRPSVMVKFTTHKSTPATLAERPFPSGDLVKMVHMVMMLDDTQHVSKDVGTYKSFRRRHWSLPLCEQ